MQNVAAKYSEKKHNGNIMNQYITFEIQNLGIKKQSPTPSFLFEKKVGSQNKSKEKRKRNIHTKNGSCRNQQ